MLEPEIKYENCEEIYTGPSPNNDTITEGMARSSESDAGTEVATMQLKRNYNETLQYMLSNGAEGGSGHMVDHYANHNYQSNMTPIGNNYYVPHQQGQLPPMAAQATMDVKVKRQRRGDANILFSHPFFQLQDDWETMRSGETITAKCLSCKVTLRGHKNVSSNFIKHMKRVHPELYKVYENYKLLKFKGYTALDATAGGGQLKAAAVNGTEPAFFDASAFLEHMSSSVDETNSTEHSPSAMGAALDAKEYNEVADAQPQTSTTGAVRLVASQKMFDNRQSSNEIDLSAKTLQQMGRLLDQKLQGFVNKSELVEERKSLQQLIENKLDEAAIAQKIHSAETAVTGSSDGAMQSQLNALQQECQQLRVAVQRTQQGKRQLQKELQSIDRQMYASMLIVRNIELQEVEMPQTAVERLLHERLELPEVRVRTVLSLFKNKTKHTLRVELENAADTRDIFRNCCKLKNTGIIVEQEMSQMSQKRRNKLLVLRKELLRRNAQLKVVVRHTQLIVSGKQFYWDALEGLCVGGCAQSSSSVQQGELEPNAVDVLNALTGLELQEFVNVLKNYDVK